MVSMKDANVAKRGEYRARIVNEVDEVMPSDHLLEDWNAFRAASQAAVDTVWEEVK